jgi:acetyltransferase-like isoleucine patch superfamily enzyme
VQAVRFYASRLAAWAVGLESRRRLLRRFPDASIDGTVQVVSPGRLELGARANVQTGTVLHCGGLEWSHGAGSIRIGADAVLSPYCVVFGAGGVEIGDRFDCGPGCMIFSSRTVYGHTSAERPDKTHVFAPVVIGDDVTLYAGCVIGPGVTVGAGAAVAAGSVVLEDVPPRTLYAGSPARKVKDL